jgi:MFS transporter, DHA1 family, inner membrane transport protein
MTSIRKSDDQSVALLDSPRSVLAMVVCIVIGEGSLISMPFVVGGIVERYDLAEGTAGIVTSLQFITMGLASIIILNIVHRIDRRRWVLVAGVLILLGHGLAIVSSNWTLFLIGRVLTGLGEGTALSIGNATAAGSARPQKAFSILAFTMAITAITIYLFMPSLAREIGAVAVFYVLTGLAALALPFLMAMPRGRLHSTDSSSQTEKVVWWPFPRLLVGIACMFIGINALWAYSERIGFSIGLDIDTIVSAFLATVIFSSLGPVLANFTEKKWGYRTPILIVTLVAGTANFVLATASFKLVFFAGIIVANITFLFLMPTYRALTAFVDPLGRLAVGSVVMQTAGTAIAPSLAGSILLLGGGYAGIGIVSFLLIMASCILVWRVARQADAARK